MLVRNFVLSGVLIVATLGTLAMAEDLSKQAGVVKMEFIFEKAPFRSCHASTIEQTKKGLVAAWFGGSSEGNSDVGIWVSRNEGKAWSNPVEVADGVQHDKKRWPCWNPVLFQPKTGPLFLFYKVGPSPGSWWGVIKVSPDFGKNWSQGWRLPEDIAGPVKNKPIQLADGTILCGSSTEDKGWRVHFERTTDLCRTWEFIEPINDGKEFGAIQPTLLSYGDGRIQALCRSQQDRITESTSTDGGKTWSKMAATSLPNPNSGIDAVTLADGRALLVYNHTDDDRSPMNVAISEDGKKWMAALVLENESREYSYPAVIQAADGMVHTTYTWGRSKVKHVVIDPSKLQLREIVGGKWPE